MIRAPRFVFASDSFKGTLSSRKTAVLLEEAARRHFPDCACVAVPMADGGEGTTEAVADACGGEVVSAHVHDPLGRPLVANYAVLPGGRAVVEVAAASGLPLLTDAERDPRLTSSYGTGELIADALVRGCVDITIALGGSATNDGGMGCARALGVRFLDGEGRELGGCGADLGRVGTIDASGLDPRVAAASFHAMCDVDNPLVGPGGASFVFGPQKGASPEIVEELDRGMRSYAHVLEATFGKGFDVPGAGAAGGLGAGCLAFLGATLESGIGSVLGLVGFDATLEGAALCVTGEGRLDSQTAHGKVISGVAATCKRRGVPCVAIVGGVARGTSPADVDGLVAVVPTPDGPMPLEEALGNAEELYAAAAERLFSIVAIGVAEGLRSAVPGTC